EIEIELPEVLLANDPVGTRPMIGVDDLDLRDVALPRHFPDLHLPLWQRRTEQHLPPRFGNRASVRGACPRARRDLVRVALRPRRQEAVRGGGIAALERRGELLR